MSEEKKEQPKQYTLEPVNEYERLIAQLLEKEISSEEFLKALFNMKLFVLTSEKYLDKKTGKIADKPELFTLFGKDEKPYLALFTGKDRAFPIQKEEDTFTVMPQITVGDFLASIPVDKSIGIVINPYWDKAIWWDAKQLLSFRNSLKREDESGLWVTIPDSDMIEIMPEGAEKPVKIPKAVFAKEILPQKLKDDWDKPESLYQTIMHSINEGFHNEVLEAAKHLRDTDTIDERGSLAFGVVAMQCGNHKDAEELFVTFLAEKESPAIRINLAKLYEHKGDKELRDEHLKQVVNAQPNFPEAIEWYATLLHQEGGKSALVEALDELDGLEGSWLPAILLGRIHLMDNELEKAYEWYGDALDVPNRGGEALLLITNDFGHAGKIQEMVDFAYDKYDIQKDDPRAGINLLQACTIIKNREKGLELCDKMMQIQIPALQKDVSELKKKIEEI